MSGRHLSRGFTLIELLTVIGIIVLVLALALPNFITMMKGREWAAAVTNIQTMVMRARALVISARKDFAVEFEIDGDNGTIMWLESESNEIERIPDIWEMEHLLGGGEALSEFLATTFTEAGGSYKEWYDECACPICGRTWEGVYASKQTCPKCHNTDWAYPPTVHRYHYDISYDPSRAQHLKYADNAKQSEWVPLGYGMTIDMAKSPHFISWDHPDSIQCYGGDTHPDLRIGTNGALVQTTDPVICLKKRDMEERRAVTLVRCTGRLVPTRVP